jgi:elongation factor G
MWFHNMNKESGGGKIKVPRIVRMHSDEMEDIDQAQAGEILAMFGVDCASGDTFTSGDVEYSMETMFVPDPVMSLAVTPNNKDSTKFGKAISRFCKEDPTFRRHVDMETKENIISGMGELHLQIYIERLAREYGVEVKVGKPRVNYREAITKRVEFNHLHKKQTGGSGQYGRIIGYMEPIESDAENPSKKSIFEFENNILGNAIPPEYISAVEKGFKQAMEKGTQIGHPVEGVRVVLTDGDAHSVDSSEMAFRLCAQGCFRSFFPKAQPTVLEPVMEVEVNVPEEYQGNTISGLNRRKGYIKDTVTDKQYTTIQCEVPLNAMFGYSTDLRTATAGKGEFSMEYAEHKPCTRQQIDELVKLYEKERLQKQTE